MQFPHLVLLALGLLSVPAHAACPPVTDALSRSAREAAIKGKLIDPALEQDLPDIGVRTQWALTRVVSVDSRCLAVLQLATFVTGTDTPSVDEAMAQVMTVRMDGGTPVFGRFENAFRVPERLRVTMGSIRLEVDLDGVPASSLPPDLYYVELEGESVLAAMKSAYAGVPVPGFSGYVARLPKLDFDLTPGREWRVVLPTYSLSRGNTAEVGDIRARFWDEDFDGYFRGANQVEVEYQGQKLIAAWIAPWDQAYLRQLNIDGKWVDLFDSRGNILDPGTLPLPCAQIFSRR